MESIDKNELITTDRNQTVNSSKTGPLKRLVAAMAIASSSLTGCGGDSFTSNFQEEDAAVLDAKTDSKPDAKSDAKADVKPGDANQDVLDAGTPDSEQEAAVEAGQDAANCTVLVTHEYDQGNTIPAGTQKVRMLCLGLLADCENVRLQEMDIHEKHVNDENTINVVRLMDGTDVLLSDYDTNPATQKYEFGSLNYNLPKGVPKTLCVDADFSTAAKSGSLHRLELIQSEDIKVDGASTVKGSFPIYGPSFNIQ